MEKRSPENRTSVKVVKNKMAPPFTKTEFDLMYGEGISEEGDLLDLAVTANLVDKSGAWFSYNGERMGQGRDQAKSFLKEHPQIKTDLRTKILAAHGIGKLLITPESQAEQDLLETADEADESAPKGNKGAGSKKAPTAGAKH
jgi:recombination protein RecA